MNQAATRLHFLDAAKVLAIYLVVFYHASKHLLLGTSELTFIRYFLYGIATISVPLFFTINGYLILNRPINFKKHILKTLRLYFFTMVWAFITFLLIRGYGANGASVGEIIHATLFLDFNVSNHLWFLFSLTSIYLLVPVVKVAFDSDDKRVILWLLFLLFIFSFGNIFANWCLQVFQHSTGQGLQLEAGRIKGYSLFNAQGINPFGGLYWGLVYFIVGGLLGRYSQKVQKLIPTWGLCLTFLIAALGLSGYGTMVSYYLDGLVFDTVFDGFSSIPGMVMTLSMLLILQNMWDVRGKIGSIVASIGANTLGIYVLHMFILRILNPFYESLSISTFLPAHLGYAVIVLLLSWLLALGLKRMPIVRHLFRI